MSRSIGIVVAALLFALTPLCVLPRSAAAHCDTMDGPVVLAGQKALKTGKLEAALIWVAPESEQELRILFKQVTAARKKGASADVLALLERYFLETLVRLHRASEGEPYIGIRPAGLPVEPSIAAADAAIASGSVDALATMLGNELTANVRHRFLEVKRRRAWTNVAGGRAFVHAYVEYVHYVETVAAAIAAKH